MAHLPSFWSFLSIFGFVFFLGLALAAESFINRMKERGWSSTKLKFVFFEIIVKSENFIKAVVRKFRIRSL